MVIRVMITFFIIQGSVFGQSRVEVKIPNAQTEAAYIWRNLGDLDFFEKNNYQLVLPKYPFIERLKEKAREKQLTDEDYLALVAFIGNHVYSSVDYQAGFQAIQKNLPLLNKMIAEIDKANYEWPFKMYKKYEVMLTLYGPGGSFDPDRGSIIIYTTSNGEFKQYTDPINTLIHEIIHIGIDSSIVRKHGVPHGLKERIVDTFVLLNFKHYLPEYRKQNMGDEKIDLVLNKKADLIGLDEIVRTFMQEK